MQKPIHILYIDDDPFVRELVRRTLHRTDQNIVITDVSSRDEFITKLKEDRFDLVLSDFEIADFNGLQVLDTVQSVNSNLPVIIITGSGSEEVAVETMRRGAADYVIKSPQHLQRLQHTIHAVLEKNRMREKQRRYVQVLRQAHDQFEAVINAIPGAVVWISSRLKVLGVNQSFADYFELKPADFKNKPLEYLGLSLQTLDFMRDFFASDQQRASKEIETRIQNQNLHFLFVGQKYHHSKSAVFVSLDISERKRVEKELAAHRHHLEELVMERTADLEQTNEQLQQEMYERKKAAEEKVNLEAQLFRQQKLESIGTLASGVAHEINNPLTGIINYANLIYSRIGDESLKEYSKGIMDEGQRVAGIVRNLLAFARQEKESHQPADIREIINAALSLLGSVLRKDQIKLEKDIPDSLPLLYCRSQQIQQVLINLLTNARDALNQRYQNNHENKRVQIRVMTLEKDGAPCLRTIVEDYGVGITPEIIERIFDPFFTTKHRNQGTGLGLSVSYGIIKEHEGELWTESVIEQYTRFYMDLPLPVLSQKEQQPKLLTIDAVMEH